MFKSEVGAWRKLARFHNPTYKFNYVPELWIAGDFYKVARVVRWAATTGFESLREYQTMKRI